MRLLALAAATLLVASAAVLAASDHARGADERAEHGKGKAHLENAHLKWNATSPAAREKGMARAEERGLFAKLTLDAAGNVAGRFVTAHLAADTLHAFTVHDGNASIPFFSAIAWGSPVEGEVLGSVLHMPGDAVSGMLHNNPTAQLQLHADGGATVTFTLAGGANATATGKQEARVNAGGIHGHVLAHNGTLVAGNGTVTVTLQPGGMAMFRAHPGKMDGTLLHAENRAITKGLMGATVRIVDGGGEALQETDGGEVEATPTAIGNGTVELTIGSEEHAGKLVTLVFDAGTFPAERADQLRVLLDGEALPRAANAEALVDEARDAVVTSTAGGQVFVALRFEHFSSYALAIEDPTTAPSGGEHADTPLAPWVAAGALLAALALALRRRQA
ncbi:MAG: hypothetical protein QOD77_2071 [Thermoplasmata archaeon]|jgi:hypothetical protein|nr:hypothetical protein [Thermoplasmata archaeon]